MPVRSRAMDTYGAASESPGPNSSSACRRRRRNVHALQVATRNYSRVAEERRLKTIFCTTERKLSLAELPPAAPALLIEPAEP